MKFYNLKQKIQYPKLALLLLSIFLAYSLFQMDFFKEFASRLNSHGYLSIFLAGILFAYGFTAALAVGFLITLAPQVNIWLAAPLAGLGALLADLLIFRFIRLSFRDEFNKLKLTLIFRKIRQIFHNNFNDKVKKYVLWTLAGFIIASPLPDELGVSLLSGLTKIDQKVFIIISFILNTLGILTILALV